MKLLALVKKNCQMLIEHNNNVEDISSTLLMTFKEIISDAVFKLLNSNTDPSHFLKKFKEYTTSRLREVYRIHYQKRETYFSFNWKNINFDIIYINNQISFSIKEKPDNSVFYLILALA